jgi:hypothetical protein
MQLERRVGSTDNYLSDERGRAREPREGVRLGGLLQLENTSELCQGRTDAWLSKASKIIVELMT